MVVEKHVSLSFALRDVNQILPLQLQAILRKQPYKLTA